jgi:hypothetical protein
VLQSLCSGKIYKVFWDQGKMENRYAHLKTFAQRQLKRYGPAELWAKGIGIPSAILASYFIPELKDHIEALENPLTQKAVIGSIGSYVETAAYFCTIINRDWKERKGEIRSAGREPTTRDLGALAKDLIAEFGIAESFDTFLIRPITLGLGQANIEDIRQVTGEYGLFGKAWQALYDVGMNSLGMLAADIPYYGWPIFYREKVRPWLMRKTGNS